MPLFRKPGLSVAAFLFVIIFLACTKAGPAGPAGAQGPAGPTGSTGPQGAIGDTGTANVIYSTWISDLSGTSATWNVPAITQGDLDSAVILVYASDGVSIVQLPFYNEGGSYVYDYISVGQIILSSSLNLDELEYRYVIIPGGVSANYVHMSYQELTSRFRMTP